MNSLNLKKTDKSAYQGVTAPPMAGVYSIRRGGLPLRGRLALALLATLALLSCDFAPPDIVIISPQEGKSYYGTLPCDLRVTDNNGVDKVEVFLDGQSVYLFTSTPYKADIEFSGYNGQSVEFYVLAYDKAGNNNDARKTVKLYPAQPECSISLANLDFGDVTVGSSKDLSITITNTGGGTLTGSVSESYSHYSITSGSGSYSLASGQSRTVTVRFAPTSTGTKTCTISTGTDCANVSATGNGVQAQGPVCSVSPTSLNFSDVTVGSTKDLSFTITNTGEGTLTGSVSEACSYYSIVSGSGSYSLTAGQSRTVTVRFAPTSTGTKTCTITTGCTNNVSCTGNGVTEPDPPICSVSPTSLNFGDVTVDSYKDLSFTITNTGGGTLTGSVSESCSEYSIFSGSGSYSLTNGQTHTVTVRFAPASEGTNKTCTVETGTSCSNVSCTGNGVPEPDPPVCSVSPTSLSFGDVTVDGSYKDMSFTITNTGGGTLSGSVSESCSHYSLVSGSGSYSLTTDQSRTVTVRFTPTSTGTKTCTISTGTSCTNVSCTGNGVPKTWSATTNEDATLWGGSQGNTNFGSFYELWVGAGGGESYRTLIDFNISSSLPAGATIVEAILRLSMGPQTYSLPRYIQIRWVTGNWSESSVTWNTMPTSAWYSSHTFKVSTYSGYVYFDVTSEVQKMVNDGLSEGFMIVSTSEGGSNHLIEFDSRETPSGKPAYLEVIYIP